MKLDFQVGVGNGFAGFGSNPQWFNFSFDAESYLNALKTRANKKGRGALTSGGKIAEGLRAEFVSNTLAQFDSEIRRDETLKYDSIVRSLDPLVLENKTMSELERLFFGKNLSQGADLIKRKLKALELAEPSLPQRDSLIDCYQKEIRFVDRQRAFTKKISKSVEAFKKSGKLRELKTQNALSYKQFKEILDDPRAFAQKERGSFFISKLLPYLTSMKIGTQPLFASASNPSTLLAKGISLELSRGDRSLSIAVGKIVNQSFGTNFFAPTTTTANGATFDARYWAVQFRKGKIHSNHRGFRIAHFSGARGMAHNYQQPYPEQNLYVINLFSRSQLWNQHWLGLEGGKSISADNGKQKDLLSSGNYTWKVSIDGRFQSAFGLSYQLSYKRTIGAYTNPLESSFSSNGYEGMTSIRLQPRKSKWSANARASFKSYEMPGNSKSNWSNGSWKATVNRRLNKGQLGKISVFEQEGYRIYNLRNTYRTVYQQTRGGDVSFTLINPRIAGLYSTSYVSLQTQQDNFPMQGLTSNVTARSWSLSLNECFQLRQHQLLFNFAGTHASTNYSDYFIGDRLDLDAGGQFTFGKRWSVGSSLVYGSLANAYSNIGIRSNVSYASTDKISFSVFADVRKAIKLTNPLFNQFQNLSCNVHYKFK